MLYRWYIQIPVNLYTNAESNLNKYFELNQLKFNDKVKNHTELIIAKPGIERQHIKDKYYDLVKCFPSDTNEIIKQMTDMKFMHDQKLNQMKTEIDLIQVKCELDLIKIQSELDLTKIKSELDLTKANHKSDMLEMELKLMKMQIKYKE